MEHRYIHACRTRRLQPLVKEKSMNFKLGIMVVTLAAIAGLSSCKTSTDPNDEPRLEMQAEMTSSTVTAGDKSETIEGLRLIDSIKIQRARILISRIKLHTAEDGEDDNKGKDVKIGPALIDIQRGKISTVFASAIPVGKYEKIKLEMHKFSSSEAVTYASDPVFGPFAVPEKVTLIVDGSLWVNGVEETFTWKDDETANRWIKFDPFVEVVSSSTTTVVLNFDPVTAFRVGGGGALLDPKDEGKRSILRGRLWGAFFLHRK